ncbi:MAG: SDR family NAD(P)-dependent oxidoreductase [Acetobacteraceae bacterium]
MSQSSQPLAIVTGASTGIGFELAKIAASKGYTVIAAADEPDIELARELGAHVETLQADLGTTEGVDALLETLAGRSVDVLCANAGRGLGHAFVDQEWDDIRRVIDTNVTGTTYLLHKVARVMKTQARGRILITGSIAGLIPGTFQAVYNASKSYTDSLSEAMRAELKGSGVTVTCLMPGPTDTEFFERADMMDTSVGAAKKDEPFMVAETGWEAMMADKGSVVAGWKNKIQAAISHITPTPVLAEMHRRMAEPGTGKS